MFDQLLLVFDRLYYQLVEGSSSRLNLPIVDGDFMGRAYPTGWQTTPNVYDSSGKSVNLLPCCFCSGDGSTMVGPPLNEQGVC